MRSTYRKLHDSDHLWASQIFTASGHVDSWPVSFVVQYTTIRRVCKNISFSKFLDMTNLDGLDAVLNTKETGTV